MLMASGMALTMAPATESIMGSLPLAQGRRRLGGERHHPPGRRRARRRGHRQRARRRSTATRCGDFLAGKPVSARHVERDPGVARRRARLRAADRGQAPGARAVTRDTAQDAFVDGMHAGRPRRRGRHARRMRSSRSSGCRRTHASPTSTPQDAAHAATCRPTRDRRRRRSRRRRRRPPSCDARPQAPRRPARPAARGAPRPTTRSSRPRSSCSPRRARGPDRRGGRGAGRRRQGHGLPALPVQGRARGRRVPRVRRPRHASRPTPGACAATCAAARRARRRAHDHTGRAGDADAGGRPRSDPRARRPSSARSCARSAVATGR